MSKQCSKCKEVKALEFFQKGGTNKDGRRSACAACCNKAMSANNAKRRKFKMTDAERSAHRSVDRAKRRSLLTTEELYGGLTYTEAVAMTIPFAKERIRLELETGQPHHIDHIVGICVGGTHTASNLQVLTAEANMAKDRK